MYMIRRSLLTLATVVLAASTVLAQAPKKVLLLTYAQGFKHPCTKGEGGKPSLVESTLRDLGKENGFEITATDEASRVTADGLKGFDALFFYTQGDLDQPGIDKAAMKPADRDAIVEFVRSGKGFIATHSGGDTFHGWFGGKENKEKPYVDMVGCEFTIHGAQQFSKVTVVDKAFPACAHLPAQFELNDEWYQYKHFSDDMHVLMLLETDGMKGDMYDRPSYPITWAKNVGKGRVFYTGMGHRDDVWTNPMYRKMIATGILWALGKVDGAAPPTYREVSANAGMPKGYVRIFNGKDFEGWKNPAGAAFEVKDGAITSVGGGKGGDVYYVGRKFADFDLGLEWKVSKQTDNSGVWLRSPEAFTDEQEMFKVAYEVQIQDNRDDEHRTGAIYGFAPAKSPSLPSRAAGQWNLFRIRCVGDHYTVWLNDVQVTDYASTTGRSKEGYIGLQNHGDTVAFRNIWVKPLGSK